MLKKITVLVLLLVVAACNPITKDVQGYNYVPSADSAYISNHIITKPGYFGVVMAKEMAAVRTIDGYPFIYAGGSSKEKMQSIASPIPLAPGKHSLVILATGGVLNRITTVSLEVKPGERYTIKALPIWQERLLADVLTMITVWIEDSAGHKVTDPVTLDPENRTPAMVPIIIPVVK